MKFTRYPRYTAKPISDRRLKYSEKALQKERDKFPLLADWVAKQQPSAQERLETIQDNNANYFQRLRDGRAESWRRSRRWLRSLPPDEQKQLINEWNNSLRPKTSEYFADFLSSRIPAMKEEGRMLLEQMVKEDRDRRLQQLYGSKVLATTSGKSN